MPNFDALTLPEQQWQKCAFMQFLDTEGPQDIQVMSKHLPTLLITTPEQLYAIRSQIESFATITELRHFPDVGESVYFLALPAIKK